MTPQTEKVDLVELRGLLAKATKGPWRAEMRKNLSVVLQDGGPQDGYCNRVAECHHWTPAAYPKPTSDEAFANAKLIAAAKSSLSALLDRIERLTKALEQRKCPSCGGSKVYTHRWRDETAALQTDHVPCSVCEQTGLHPIARSALNQGGSHDER